MQVRISWSAGNSTATLDADTPTTQALTRALPLTSSACIWGEEVYFDTGIAVSRETDARQVMEPDTVAFWADGDALALPYGPTPISRGSGSPRTEFGGNAASRARATFLEAWTGMPALWRPCETVTPSVWNAWN